MDGIVSKTKEEKVTDATNQRPSAKVSASIPINLRQLDLLQLIAELRVNSYHEKLMNLKIPTGNTEEVQKAFKEEKEWQFMCVFHQELEYRNKLKSLPTSSFFNHFEKIKKIKKNNFNMFLKAVRHDYLTLANDLLIHYPEFLTKKGDVDNKLNDTPSLKNKNALECACYEGNVEMIEMLLSHYEDPREALTILDQYYPDETLDPEFIELELESTEENNTLFNFDPIIKVINDNEAILKKYDINIYIQREENLINQDTANDDTKKELQTLEKATSEDIKTFEKIRKEIGTYQDNFVDYGIKQDKNMTLKNTFKSLKVFNKNLDEWNPNQRILFFSNIFGFVERHLSCRDANSFCRNDWFVHVINIKDYVQRLLVHTSDKKHYRSFFSSLLGTSFGIRPGEPRGVACRSPIPFSDESYIKILCQQKAKRIKELKEQLREQLQEQLQQQSRHVMHFRN